MRKIIITFLVLLSSFSLIACMKEEDYYTKIDVDLRIDVLEKELDELTSQVDSLKQQLVVSRLEADQLAADILALETNLIILAESPIDLALSQAQRYGLSLLKEAVLGENSQFGEVNTEFSGLVFDWDYAYIILELDKATTLELRLIDVAPGGNWNINIYLDGTLYTSAYSFENVVDGDIFYIEVSAGFVTIEFDSYAESTYEYLVRITEVANE